MYISSTEKTAFQPVASCSEADQPKTMSAPKPLNDESVASREPVSISGRAFLMARCFEGYTLEPSVLRYAPELSGAFPTLFLTHQDRNILSDVYAFANEQGVDLAYVDDLALEIAHFRRMDNGQEMLPQRPLMSFDLEGHEVTYRFNEQSAATASRILSSEGMKSTIIDKDFLRFTLDVAYSPMSTLNFDFLEQIVSRFSDEASTVADFGSRFSHFQRERKNYIKMVSEEVYDLSTRLPRGKKSVDGDTAIDAKRSARPETPASLNLSATLRQIIQKYLRESGLPTLFDTLRRLGK